MLNILHNKDITTVSSPAHICHGVNCQRVMGSGVAKALFTKWPQVRFDYMERSKESMYLGGTQIVEVEQDLYVINCFTQEFFGNDGKKYADIHAIESCLYYAVLFAKDRKYKDLYIPAIGCGLAGLSLEDDLMPVLKKLEEAYPEININLCLI